LAFSKARLKPRRDTNRNHSSSQEKLLNLRFLDRLQPLGLLALRVVLGAILIGYGYGKVFGGLHKMASMAAGLGLPPWLGYVSALTEFAGGMLLAAGLFTRLASIAVCVNMLVAVKSQWHGGFLHGYDYPLACAAMAFALIFLGAGPISFDWAFSGGGGGKR
jgi:putative oxidoreductase